MAYQIKKEVYLLSSSIFELRMVGKIGIRVRFVKTCANTTNLNPDWAVTFWAFVLVVTFTRRAVLASPMELTTPLIEEP